MIQDMRKTMAHIYQAVQRRRPIPESHSPYDWRDNTQAQEIMWEEEIIGQLLILFNQQHGKRTCNVIFMSMNEKNKLLFSKCVGYSKDLGLPSTKYFLSACTNGTIDKSTLGSLIEASGSRNVESADIPKLLVSQGGSLFKQS